MLQNFRKLVYMCHEMKKDENYWLRGQANMGSVEIHFEDQDETATV